jgi:hypothetical protein
MNPLLPGRPPLAVVVVVAAAASAAWGLSCAGPDAPDGAVCRDVIHRLCLAPRCTVVTLALGVGDTCEAALVARTGCAAEDFTFPEPPGRARVLECRLALLRAGSHPDQHPDCTDVTEMIDVCADVTAFFAGSLP